MTERSGANPIPPATITRSRPAASASGQPVPYGPRTPSTSPALSFAIARVTTPAARVVCRSGEGASGFPLIEIGTSPTPKT